MAAKYIDREGKPLTSKAWHELRAEESYCVVREYDNGAVRVRLLWSGAYDPARHPFPDYYPLYLLSVQNYNSAGNLVNDPADGDKTFPTEATGIAAYETFLAKWTESEIGDDGLLVEKDNLLTPPPPPDPNRPQTEPDAPELGGVGAW